MGLLGTTTSNQSGPGNNGNKEVLHIPQKSRIKALPSDGVYYHIQNTCATTPVQSGPGSNGNEGVRNIPQSW